MATIARTVRAVAPHVPKIKFPSRNKADFSFKPEAPVLSSVTQTSTSPTASRSSTQGPVIDFSELPLRYQRKLISQEEMEYIERGGPA
ncbi:small subunit ribosomal protein S36 [Mytilus galloprovincialis]|uniref:Small subunit ribosomal protein S36 n=1 Tax=Mytilus galloprovincialis TaxID=29158 RepID=A0A8B6EXV5_MYTGA|nr:small subunit ribosomal protein S36 [Mytilus galloprovincialis]VDI41696.1 small subunit ribosomal protein S36 [Mytilus galloprovincialis]